VSVPPELFTIVTGLVRSGDTLLMIEQAGPGEEPVWSVPGGRVEPGELVAEALVRELREETGVRVLAPGRLGFSVQVDQRQDGWFATVFSFDVSEWEGELAVDDPDGFVRQAAWVPFPEALDRLERISWHRLTARYLRGELEPRSLWLRRVQEDGSEQLSGPY
jgi:8-oxo-dGTP diphosphatase